MKKLLTLAALLFVSFNVLAYGNNAFLYRAAPLYGDRYNTQLIGYKCSYNLNQYGTRFTLSFEYGCPAALSVDSNGRWQMLPNTRFIQRL